MLESSENRKFMLYSKRADQEPKEPKKPKEIGFRFLQLQVGDEVPDFREVGACGTATVCVPIASITDGEVVHEFGGFSVLNELREELVGIQLGEREDKHGWMREVEL